MNMRVSGRGVLRFVIGAAVIWVAVIAVVVPLALAAFAARERLTVRSYPVAPEIAGEMQTALIQVLNTPPLHGEVALTRDGHLVVTAPESVQDQVQAILQDVDATKPGPTPTINFEIWLVSAAPEAAAKVDNGPGLSEIASALSDIQKAQQGREPLHFNLLEKLSVQVRAGGNESHIGGPHASMEISNATVRHDAKGLPVIAARIELNQQGHAGELEAVVELPAGQLLVLGQSGLAASGAAHPDPQSQLYYLVRASL